MLLLDSSCVYDPLRPPLSLHTDNNDANANTDSGSDNTIEIWLVIVFLIITLKSKIKILYEFVKKLNVFVIQLKRIKNN